MDSSKEKPLRTLKDYIAIARRRLWWLVIPLVLGWAMVLSAAWFVPPRYRSETVIIVEQQKVPEQYVLPNVAADLQQRLQSMTQQILSRTRLLGVIDSMQLYGQNNKQRDPDVLVQQMRRDIKIDMVQAPGRPWELSAFKISYSAPNPALAQQVTNKLSSLFIEENLRNRQQLSENTTKFLENQLETARKNLADQEERLSDFKSRYLGELPEQLQTNIQILSGLQARLQAATEALDKANQQKLYLESLLNQYRSLRAQLVAVHGNSTVNPLTIDQELDALRSELVTLSGRDTANHPDVVRVKEQIAATEKLKEDMEAIAKSGKPEDLKESGGKPKSLADLQAISPMLQIEGEVKSNKLEIANRQQELRDIQRQIELYQNRLNLTPVREQQLAAITRDHDQSRANYESLLNKKMQSEMATSLEKRQEGEQFRIIDPPNFPQKPYWPNRFKFSLIGLAFGMLLAVGIATWVETIDERIYSQKDLESVTPVPILIAIPLLATASEQGRQLRYRRLQLTAAGLLMAMVSAMTLFSYYKG